MEVEAQVVEMPAALHSQLQGDEVEHIESMLSVGELEMAFESLGLSVMAQKAALGDMAAQMLDTASLLDLDRESVFDPDF